MTNFLCDRCFLQWDFTGNSTVRTSCAGKTCWTITFEWIKSLLNYRRLRNQELIYDWENIWFNQHEWLQGKVLTSPQWILKSSETIRVTSAFKIMIYINYIWYLFRNMSTGDHPEWIYKNKEKANCRKTSVDFEKFE